MCFVHNVFSLCTLTLVTTQFYFVRAELKPINIMGLLPMTGEKWSGGGACLTATDMALRHVNEREDILKGYELKLMWRDGKCDIAIAINRMYDLLYSKPQKHMILGPGCSEVLEVAAQVTPAWNITHITYGGASPLLSDRNRYPRLFKIEAPDSRYNLARIALSRHFGWKKIATLNVALDYFSAVTDDLVNMVTGTEISIISQEIFDYYPLTRIQNLKKKDARIIMLSSYENHATRVLCAAYIAGLYGPKIVWMFPGWYRDQWWKAFAAEVTCTEDEMARVAEGSILTGNFYENMKVERGIANLTVNEYRALFELEDAFREEYLEYESIALKCYDVIWAMGLAMNCTETRLKEIGHPKSVSEFEFSDSDIGDIVTACVHNVSFIGVTGQVKFDITGDPMRNIKIDQVQGGKKTLVGIYRTDVETPHFQWFHGGIVWAGYLNYKPSSERPSRKKVQVGNDQEKAQLENDSHSKNPVGKKLNLQSDDDVPRDSTLVREVEVLISSHLYVVMSCFAGFGIVLAVSLFIFNVIYRENVYIKLSSPNINNVLLLGCIITYCSVFLESLDQRQATLCKMRTFTFCIGFSMAFGALFSKTWRVYRIFSNKKLLRLRIKDSQLVVIVLGIIGVLVFVLLLWELIDPLYIIIRHLDKQAYRIDTDAEVLPYVRECTSDYHSYFSWTIYIMEGALLTFGAFLSFETRKVKIAALNDSHFIGTCLYNVVVLSAVGLTLNLVLDDKVDLLYGLISGIIIVGTTATQLVVFIPKIMYVYNPNHADGDKHDSANGAKLGGVGSSMFLRKKIAPRDPCDTTISNMKPTVSFTEGNDTHM